MTKAVLIRADGTLGPTALKMVEDMASEGKSRRTIAAALGVSHKKFEKMLERGKGDNPERLAWERGFAVIEQLVADDMLAAGRGTIKEDIETDPETGETIKVRERVVSKIAGAQLMFYAKTQLGWSEKPQGALVQDNRIQITLPAPMTTEQYYKTLGIEAPMDFRKDKSKPHPLLPGSGLGERKAAPSGLPAEPTPKKEPTDGK